VELIGPLLVGCAVLVVAGLAKARRPGDSARALAGPLSLPVASLGPGLRAGGVLEAALGVTAAATLARPLLGAVAASYLLFAAVVLVVRRRGGALAGCGCLGSPDTPATGVHVVVDLGLAAAAVAVAVAGPRGGLGTVLAHQPARGVPLLVLAGLGAALVVTLMTAGARLVGARRTWAGRP